MRPAYPKKLVVKEVSEGFSIILETGEVFPRNEKQYHLFRTAEELLVFLMGVYNWHPNIDCPGCGLNLNVVSS